MIFGDKMKKYKKPYLYDSYNSRAWRNSIYSRSLLGEQIFSRSGFRSWAYSGSWSNNSLVNTSWFRSCFEIIVKS